MQIESAKEYILNLLKEKLPKYLTYHCFEHTIDVYNEAKRIALSENINDETELKLILTAALFHDSGFTVSELSHEQQSCIISTQVLPQYNYNDSQISKICEIIMATKIPQSPSSHLAEIICDADLDYLGRNDFEKISDSLFEEFKYRNIVKDQKSWDTIQLNFFKSHHYFTRTNIELRNKQKEKNLQKILENLNNYV
ncbi:MAG: HD domain-containing protein [Bacteroidetes bacterium]|nr:HD domain-containing protein [Bacteroidota bacterium]